jgi:hypothetical protein
MKPAPTLRRPTSARFGAAFESRGTRHPFACTIPIRLTGVAGASGSVAPTTLPGLLPPQPASPGLGCPQLQGPCCDRGLGRSLTSHGYTAPRSAQSASNIASITQLRRRLDHAVFDGSDTKRSLSGFAGLRYPYPTQRTTSTTTTGGPAPRRRPHQHLGRRLPGRPPTANRNADAMPA